MGYDLVMKNLKPSYLPIKTVIMSLSGLDNEDLYIKSENGFWEDLFSGCGCCTDSVRVSDNGCGEEDKYSRGGPTTTKTSDDYFTEYKVIAAPPGYEFDESYIHGVWSRDSWTFADGTGLHACGGFNCEA